MVYLKLLLLVVVLLGIAMLGFAIKIIFQKNANPINTSCGSVGDALQEKGVDACATGGCSDEKIEECKTEGRIEVATYSPS